MLAGDEKLGQCPVNHAQVTWAASGRDGAN